MLWAVKSGAAESWTGLQSEPSVQGLDLPFGAGPGVGMLIHRRREYSPSTAQKVSNGREGRAIMLRGRAAAALLVLDARGVLARTRSRGAIPPWGWVLIGILVAVALFCASLRFIWYWTRGPGAEERRARRSGGEPGQELRGLHVGSGAQPSQAVGQPVVMGTVVGASGPR